MSARKESHKQWRCGRCGHLDRLRRPVTSYSFGRHLRVDGDVEVVCAADVAPIPWTDELGYAWHYVNAQAAAGVRLDGWVNTCNLDYWTGATRADLAVALTYARRWRLPEFHEGELPPMPVAKGLFG